MRATLQKTENGYGLKEMVAFVSSVRPEHKHHKLSLKNCKTIEFGYDLDELFESVPRNLTDEDDKWKIRAGFITGFQKALEILGDKKFTKDDVMLAWDAGVMSNSICTTTYLGLKRDEQLKRHRESYQSDLMQTSLQQTEWSVEVEMENDINQCDGCKAGHELDGYLHIDPKTGSRYMGCQKDKYQRPKLDADGCLILKHV